MDAEGLIDDLLKAIGSKTVSPSIQKAICSVREVGSICVLSQILDSLVVWYASLRHRLVKLCLQFRYNSRRLQTPE